MFVIEEETIPPKMLRQIMKIACYDQHKTYNEINFLLTIIMFAIYKAYCISNGKEKILDVYRIFKYEFKNSLLLRYKLTKFVPTLLKQCNDLI